MHQIVGGKNDGRILAPREITRLPIVVECLPIVLDDVPPSGRKRSPGTVLLVLFVPSYTCIGHI